MPKCSVIIPVYNAEMYVGMTIASALEQTIKDIEIIAVNDCSTDSTANIVEAFAHADGRIRYFTNSKNLGVAATRNRGVELAAADWIAFLDGDDVWNPDKLEKQLTIAETTHADLVYTGAYMLNDSGKPTGKKIRVPEHINYDKLLCGNDIICSSVLIRRSLLLECPMERGDLHEDFICWLNILRNGAVAFGLDEPLVGYRLTAGSKSRSKWKSAIMMWKSYDFAGVKGLTRIRCFVSYTIHGLQRYLGGNAQNASKKTI